LCGSQNKAIISLYNINWLIFITETESVYCAVRIYSVSNPEGHSMAQSAAGLTPPMPSFNPRPIHARYVVEKCHCDTILSKRFRFPL